MVDLLNVDRALEQILAQIHRLGPEDVPLAMALGRVLAEDVYSDLDLPPFANSAMDGYAVQAADVQAASPDSPVQLDVVMDITAGNLPSRTLAARQAARIMTGAPVPENADAVVPVEDTDADWATDTQLTRQVNILHPAAPGDNVRPAGSDLAAGVRVIASGTELRPQELGMLAGLGYTTIRVFRRPRVVILSHGDELIDPSARLAPGKIRDVNSTTLTALVQSCGGEPIALPIIPDDIQALRQAFNDAPGHDPDLIISSAGASVGVTDLIRTILNELGAVSFWRINLRPGKPLIFGRVRLVPFFGLPGNPVSAMVTFDVLVRPALLKQAGRADLLPIATAILGEPLKSDGRRTYVRVKLHRAEGRLIATTTGSQNSSTLMSLVLADGLLIVPEDVTYIQPGTALPVRLLRPGQIGPDQDDSGL